MKNKEKKQFYSGRTTFMGKEVSFEIEEFVMRLFVESEIIHSLFFEETSKGSYTFSSKKKSLDINNLKCLTSDKRYSLSVYFEKDIYYADNILNPNTSTLIISFHHLIVTDMQSTNKENHHYIGIASKNFYKFLGMVPNYKIEDLDSTKFSIDLNYPTKTMEAVVNYKGHEVTVYPHVQWTYNHSSLDYSPTLLFRFDSFMDEETLISFVDVWLNMFRYLFMRNNIYPDAIHLTIGVFCSELFIPHQKQEKDLVEDLNNFYSDSICWADIYQHIPKLFELMYSEDLYMLNLKSSIAERLSAGIYSASLDAAAFDSEFDKLYPNGFKHREQKIEAEKEIETVIKSLHEQSTGDKRRIYKKLLSKIKSETLCDQMEFAFDDNKNCLKSLKKRFAPKFTYDEISIMCSEFRNAIDHGNKHGEIDDQLVCAFIMLRGLVYSMQLRRCGVEDNKIDYIVYRLFNIKR